jgi:hypothetical protein
MFIFNTGWSAAVLSPRSSRGTSHACRQLPVWLAP